MTDTAIRPSSRRKRIAILNAATSVFLEHGFAGASMDEIATLAGVSKQTVYTHFGSKERLFLSIVESITATANADFKPGLPSISHVDDLRDWLVDFAVAQLTVVMTPEIARVRRLAIAEQSSFPDFARHFYDAGPNKTVELVAPVLIQASDLGLIHVTDSEAIARDFNWMLMSEAIMRSLLLGEDAQPPEGWSQMRARTATEIILRACRRHEPD